MKILILTHSYPDTINRWRGVFVQEQAKALSAIHEVIVVYFKVDYTCFAPFSKYSFLKRTNQRITEYELTTSRSFPVINQLKYLLNTYYFIKREILRNNKIDLIHSHLSYPAGFLGTLIYKRKNIPNVITEHTSISKYFRSFIHYKCIRYALKNSRGVVCVSNALRNEILRVADRDISVIHNVVDFDKFKPADPGPDDIINIGFLGGLGNNNKGLDLLLKSFSLLDRHNYFLHIGGNGILLDHYVKMAEEYNIINRCRFYGEILPEDKVGFYSKLNIFVLPSRYETFGIVLVEAMACGIPVIATKCGGPEEIVTDSTGILIEKDNPEKLAEAITKMCNDIKLFNKVTIRNYAINKFSSQVFLENISILYNKIIQHTDERK